MSHLQTLHVPCSGICIALATLIAEMAAPIAIDWVNCDPAKASMLMLADSSFAHRIDARTHFTYTEFDVSMLIQVFSGIW